MYNRCWIMGLVGMLGLLGSTPIAAAQCNVPGAICQVPYYIDVQSFDNLFPANTAPERIVEDAARQWNWAGGSRDALDYVGSTTNDTNSADGGCPYDSNGNNYNVIYATPSLSGGGWCAYTTPCQQSWHFSIQVWPQDCAGMQITDNATAGEVDLQNVVEHEFGHALGLKHQDPPQTACDSATPWCMMNPHPCPNDRSRRFFCQQEIDAASAQDGVASAAPYWLLQPNGWPSFSTTGWETGAVNQDPSYGYGVGAISPADIDRVFFWTDVTTTEHPVEYCYPYVDQFINSPCTPTAIPYSSSEMRPAVAYDTTRGNWWVFWRDRPGSLSNTDTEIIYSVSSDLINWSTPADLVFGLYQPVPLSRLPVGATYDWLTDSIVVVFANWNQGDTSGNGDFTCTNAYGCSGELNLTTIAAGSGSPRTFNGPWDLGVMATTSPAVACEYSGDCHECQVLLNGETPHRNVLAFQFCLDTGGVLCSYNVCEEDPITAVWDSEGWTDDPIGLTFNGTNRQGYFVAMITEANPQGYVSYMEKQYVGVGSRVFSRRFGRSGTPAVGGNFPGSEVAVRKRGEVAETGDARA